MVSDQQTLDNQPSLSQNEIDDGLEISIKVEQYDSEPVHLNGVSSEAICQGSENLNESGCTAEEQSIAIISQDDVISNASQKSQDSTTDRVDCPDSNTLEGKHFSHKPPVDPNELIALEIAPIPDDEDNPILDIVIPSEKRKRSVPKKFEELNEDPEVIAKHEKKTKKDSKLHKVSKKNKKSKKSHTKIVPDKHRSKEKEENAKKLINEIKLEDCDDSELEHTAESLAATEEVQNYEKVKKKKQVKFKESKKRGRPPKIKSGFIMPSEIVSTNNAEEIQIDQKYDIKLDESSLNEVNTVLSQGNLQHVDYKTLNTKRKRGRPAKTHITLVGSDKSDNEQFEKNDDPSHDTQEYVNHENDPDNSFTEFPDDEEKPKRKRGRKKSIPIVELVEGDDEDGPKVYGCGICDYKTSKRIYVAQHHYRVHKENSQFKCPHCSYVGKIKSALVNHMKIHSGVKPLKCSLCDYATCERTNLAVHMSRHTGIKKFKCPHCDYSAMRIGRIQMHMSTHTGLKMLKCDVCGHGFNTNAKLKEHRRLHTGEKPFKCAQCNYSCRLSLQLKTHMHTHFGSPFVCGFCGDGFSAKASLSHHEERHKGAKGFMENSSFDKKKYPSSSGRTKLFKCPHCTHCGSSQENVDLHIQKKHRVAWKCSICSIQFKSAEDFAKHSEEHGNEENDTKPNYKCGFCEQQFESVDVLTEHFRAHMVGDDYKCLQCDFITDTHKALKEHIHKKSGTVYKCSECEYKSYHLDHVTHHLKTHTGPIKVYSCIHCEFRSRDLEVFNTHKCFESDGGKVVELSVDQC